LNKFLALTLDSPVVESKSSSHSSIPSLTLALKTQCCRLTAICVDGLATQHGIRSPSTWQRLIELQALGVLKDVDQILRWHQFALMLRSLCHLASHNETDTLTVGPADETCKEWSPFLPGFSCSPTPQIATHSVLHKLLLDRLFPSSLYPLSVDKFLRSLLQHATGHYVQSQARFEHHVYVDE
jgi:hypothetical protein